MKKETPLRERSFSNFGFSTILISFTMICIVTFLALSLITANADYKLSKKTAEKTKEYYAAQESAYNGIADISEILETAYNESQDRRSYESKAVSLLQNYRNTTTFLQFDMDTANALCCTVPISDTQILTFTLQPCYPEKSSHDLYRLTDWHVITNPPEPDTTLHLLGNN